MPYWEIVDISYQSNICERAQCHHSDFPRIKFCLTNQKRSSWFFNGLPLWWRKILVAKSICTMDKICNTKFCSFLHKETRMTIISRIKCNKILQKQNFKFPTANSIQLFQWGAQIQCILKERKKKQISKDSQNSLFICSMKIDKSLAFIQVEMRKKNSLLTVNNY